MPGTKSNIEGDLFGKIYTYEELLMVERKKNREKPSYARDMVRPEHWPVDTEVDPGRWALWLPEGWGQGVKQTCNGKPLQCYVSPPHPITGVVKRFFHKPKVADYCQKEGLPGLKEEAADPEPKEKKVITVHDKIPAWPDWHLPRNWRLAFKQLPTGPHKIYIPPDQDTGFLYHRSCVEEYLEKGFKKLVLFDESKPMAQRSEEAAANAGEKKKRKKGAATLEDYVESSEVMMVSIVGQNTSAAAVDKLKKADVPHAEEVVNTSSTLHGLLLKRSFPENTEMIIVCSRTPLKEGSIASIACGHYFQMQTGTDRPYYQKCDTGLSCQGIYIAWAGDVFGGSWKIGSLANNDMIVAINKEDQISPMQCKSQWRVLREDWGST